MDLGAKVEITDKLFTIIDRKAFDLNIYTSELCYKSKAFKVFKGTRLDFIDEEIIKKELLLYLMNPKTNSDHIKLLRSFDPLILDPILVPTYIKILLNDSYLSLVSDEIEILYEEEGGDITERINMLSLMDNEYLGYDK